MTENERSAVDCARPDVLRAMHQPLHPIVGRRQKGAVEGSTDRHSLTCPLTACQYEGSTTYGNAADYCERPVSGWVPVATRIRIAHRAQIESASIAAAVLVVSW